MPGVNANKVEFIFNPLKYFSLGENFKINCKIDSTVQQHIVEVKIDNVSSKKTIEGLDVDIFPLEFVGEISAGNHSINVAIYEENEVIGRMFYPCITVYDYNDYSIQYITDNNDKNPYISTYYIEPIVNINEEWEIEIFVDDFYCSGYRNLNIGDEKTYEIHVEIDDKHIVYDNLSHGNHFIKMPALSEYKVYDFILYAKDNLGYESHVLLNEVWVKPEIEENIYQMTEDDLVTYGITNKKVENIVPIYCNEEEYNAIMAVAKNSRYLTRNEILSSKDEVVNYNIPSGEYVCFIPDFNNDGEYDPFEGWLYKEQYTRYAEDYNTEEIYNMAESNRIGLQQFIDDKIEEGYTTVKLIENGYFIVNDLSQLDSANVEYRPGSIIIEGANNFTLDLNGSTIKMNANANASSKIVTLSKSFNSHVKNGIIDGDVFTHDYDNSTNNSEWNQIAGIHDDCRYCSFENLTMSHSSGYGYVGGSCGILKNGDRMYTSYIILCPKFVYGDIDDNGNVIESNDRSISDFIDISTAISKYKSFYGEDIKYIRGQISKYLGYQGNGLCNWNLKVFMYDENKNLIHKRVGYQYREVDIPVNTKYIRVVALADYNFFDVGTGIRLVHFFRPINCVTKNVTIKEIRGTGGAWTGSNNCLFTDMEIRSVGNHVTPTAFDFEDGWDQMQDVTMRNIRCFGDGGGSTNLMTCGGHNFIYENIGHDSEAVAYNYGRTRHYVYRNCVSNNKFAQNYQSIIRTGTPRMYNCDIKTLSNSENPNIFINFKSDHIDRGTIYNSTVKNHIINNYFTIISTCDIINSNVICNGWSGHIGRKAYFVNDRFICEDENNFIDIAINTGGNVMMYDCTFDSFTRFRNHTDLSLLYVENCSFPKGVAIEPNVIEKNFQKDIMFKKCNITIDSLEHDFISTKPYAYSAGPVKVTFEDCVITIKDIGPNKSIWYDNSKSTEGVIKFINCKFIFETEDKIGLFTTFASNKLGRTNLLVKMIKCEMIDDITKTTVKNTEGIKYFETNTDEIIIDTNQPRLVYLNNEDVIIPYCSVSSNDGVIETHGVIRSLTDEEFNNINIDNYNVDQGYINDSISSNTLPLGEYQYEVYAVDSYGLRSEPLTMSLTINEYIEENDFTEIVVDIPTDNYELVLIGSSELIINTGEINWGDGTEDILTTDNLSHTYTTAGEYTIRGKFIFGKGIKPTNTIKNVLIKVNKLCSNYSLNLNNAFEGMNRLETFNCDNIRVDNLANTFNGCNALTSLDISNWNTDKVTNMYGMFKDCKLLTSLNLSNWDTSNVTDMSSMFHGCNSLTTLDVSNWNTSKVTNMYSMFRDCTNLISLDVSNWNTDNVTNMSYMFQYNYVLTTLDVSNWNTSEVTSMNNMFYACRALTTLDVSNWNTSNVTNMAHMFYDCSSLTSLDVSNFNTSNVTYMTEMFHNCSSLTSLDVSNFNTSKVTNIGGMFHTCQSLTTLDVSNFNTSNVTNMYMMFYNCKLLTSLDVSKWDISKVTNMYNMFINCTNLTSITMNNSDYNSVNKIITQLPTRTSDSMGHLYIEGVDDHKLVNKSEAKLKYWAIMTIFPNIKYYTLANEAEETFAYPIINSDESVLSNSSISVIPIENEGSDETVFCLEIETQEDINSIQFVNPECLLKMLILDTSNMTTMKDLFKNCTQLNSIECSDWDTSNVTDMSYMFVGCESLTQLDLSNWDISNVTTMESMFYNCTNLISITMNNSDYNSVNKVIAQLPTRASDNLGVLSIAGVDDISQVNINDAKTKFWIIENFREIKSIKINNKDISKVYKGSLRIKKMYIG